MTAAANPCTRTLILFGAFDRHNLGDLLFPHIAAALLPDRPLVFAGLADRDLRPFGGHSVIGLPRLAAEQPSPGRPKTVAHPLGGLPRSGGGTYKWRHPGADILHVGGELLTCDVWQAAVMLLPPEEAGRVIATCDAGEGRLAWAQRELSCPRRAAYVLPKAAFSGPVRTLFSAVGGVELPRCDTALRSEVLEALREAEFVSVRDAVTRRFLARQGVAASLVPDPAVVVAELFAERIAAHGARGEPAAVRSAFPQGYLAVQFSAEFGDDATLAHIAAALERAAQESGCGVVFFRAGAAPWHDDIEIYRRCAARLRAAPARLFGSLDIWDACALIAGSRACCGSSLHGRIVAEAFGVPAASLLPASDEPGKVAAYVATWPAGDSPAVATADALYPVLSAVLAQYPHGGDTTHAVRARCREHFAALRARLES